MLKLCSDAPDTKRPNKTSLLKPAQLLNYIWFTRLIKDDAPQKIYEQRDRYLILRHRGEASIRERLRANGCIYS